MGLQEALAAVLTCEAELATLREDPARLQHRYGLSDAELAMLAGAPPAGFRVTAESVRSKLVQKVTACLPVTVAELKAHYPELLEGFASATVRRPQPGEGLTGSGEPERLVAWIDGRASAPLVDFARYELLCGQLARDRQATQAAQAAQATQAPQMPQAAHTAQAAQAAQVARKPTAAVPDDLEPVLEPVLAPDGAVGEGTPAGGVLSISPTVRVAFFDHDVTAEVPPARLPARHTSILLQRQWGEPAVRVYRINDATAALLDHCDGTRNVTEVIAAVGVGSDQVTGMLTRFVTEGVVCVAADRY
ncbi:hypothetical protein OG884_07970 [Streptosporangium sp. NBC_01755]|uniref:hypothetical protein n=1 Tax=unclassified Streptosporangium TaxID=2632669 RepID=UPI002DD97422|nr:MULTISPECIES: hypothetical protein [unclassified Streptosporangium]WSA26730.1 hypothetical protein OIE13_02185 [Streptosporangium sp. NBC_01810]WSD01845.1 hypothetical protein OG884_07970 [Streptosporangium sp. NBC_01755]